MAGRRESGYTRFREEEELDATLKEETERKRLRKFAVMFYLICVVMIPVLIIIFLLVGGMTSDPLYLPAWAILFPPIVMGIAALIGHLIITIKRTQTALDDHDAKQIVRSSMMRVLIVLIVCAIFMVLFASILPLGDSNWLEDYIEDNHGIYTQEVSDSNAGDFKFQGRDVYGLTGISVKATVPSEAEPVDMYIGEFDRLRDENLDPEDFVAVRNASLPDAYATDVRNFTYSGKDFEAGIDYALRIYNYDGNETVTATIKLHRHIDEGVIWALFVFMVVGVGVSVVWVAFCAARRKAPARARAPPRRAPAPPSRAERARDAMRGMEEEVDELFVERGEARPREGMPPPPARPPARAPARAEAARRAEPVLEKPTSEKKSIKCPRCATRFSYMKREGIFEIKCPKCGKRGRVGKPRAAPPKRKPVPDRELIPAREPARAAAPARAPPGPPAAKKKTIACPKCKKRFQIEEKPRPFKIECPHCGKTGMLK